MKKVRICYEVRDRACEKDGGPQYFGMFFGLGEVSDETYASIDYFDVMKDINPLNVLRKFGGIGTQFCAEDFRLISPEEYDARFEGEQG